MAAGLAMPQQSISLMLADPLTTADFTDITPLCKKWHSKRGRNHENRTYENGTVDVTLNNQDGRFSPWNTNGPYYNLLSPTDDLTNFIPPSSLSLTSTTNIMGGLGGTGLFIPPVILDTPGVPVPRIVSSG